MLVVDVQVKGTTDVLQKNSRGFHGRDNMRVVTVSVTNTPCKLMH